MRLGLIGLGILTSGTMAFGQQDGGALVLTPGGYRSKALVHHVANGQVVREDGSEMLLVERATGRTSESLTVDANADVTVPFTSGWITYSAWTNPDQSHPISSFTTAWTVPPAPTTNDGQTIFYFNGIENAAHNKILQPVLQWGGSDAGGGAYWTVGSWYVGSNGQALYSSLVKVNPGDKLVGVMTLTANSKGEYSYKSEFVGIAGTALTVQNVGELVWGTETLEAYGVGRCSDYPNTDKTAFTAIGIETTAGQAPLTWNAVDVGTACGEHTVVVDNSPVAGEVDLFLRN